jgi:glycosyltransferase involved in cell wall biosynthesis
MASRNLLLLTYHFPPSAASGTFRLLGFARHLPAFGWRTTVVAPPQLPWEPVDPALEQQVPPSCTVYPVPYPARLPKAIRWAAPYAVWLPWALRAARRAVREQRPDAILTSGPPHWVHLLGLSLQGRYRLPWIADFRDPWMTTNELSATPGLRGRWERFWEQRVLDRADVLLTNAPNAAATLREACPAVRHKVLALTNGYDPEVFEAVSPAPPGEVIRIVHAGQLYAGRDPRPLLDALQGARAVRPFRVEFLGRTTYQSGADFAADLTRRGLEGVVVSTGQLAYADALRAMCQADILLLLDNPGRRVGVPAKLYEYLGAGRPILAVAEPDGDVAAILQESGVPHKLVSPSAPEQIRQGLLVLIAELAEGRMTTPGVQRLAFTREQLAGRLADILDGYLRPGRLAVEDLLRTTRQRRRLAEIGRNGR